VRAQAALVLHPPTAFASHVTAARVFGLPVPDIPDEHVCVLSSADRRPQPGLKPHVARPGARVARYRGIRLSELCETFVQLASMLSLVDLVAVGDAMVKKFKIPVEELVEHCASGTDKHILAARRAASYVREGVDSPMETRLRMLIVLAGLPEPEVNFKLYDEQGRVRRRLDLSYPGFRLIVEYDGRQHAEDPGQWSSDLERREELDDGHWRILVVTAKGIYREPERTPQRVRKALVARGHTGVPRHLSDDWRPFFPARGRATTSQVS
jgi:very-short-patch-repair endonuclease